MDEVRNTNASRPQYIGDKERTMHYSITKEKIEDLLEIIGKESKDSIEELETGTSSEIAKLAFVEGKMEVISKISGWLATVVNEMIAAKEK